MAGDALVVEGVEVHSRCVRHAVEALSGGVGALWADGQRHAHVPAEAGDTGETHPVLSFQHLEPVRARGAGGVRHAPAEPPNGAPSPRGEFAGRYHYAAPLLQVWERKEEEERE